MARFRMPGHSSLSLIARQKSRSFSGMVTVNGIKFMRRRIASLTDRRAGLWLPKIASLNCGA